MEVKMKIAIGCDEAAYRLKVEIMKHLSTKADIEVTDFGAMEGDVILYPDVAYTVADAVASGKFERGILVCGTGIGMSICANKVPGIRAAVCHDPFSTERSRKSNNAQIMCMGERVIGVELAKYLVDLWLQCDFGGGSSAPKVERIDQLEIEHINNMKNVG
jgi:ribose 5-phosphate isomerase B